MVIKWFNRTKERVSEEQVVYVPLSRIIRSPFLVRKNFHDEEIAELAQSIRTYGVIQPVILRRQGDLYQLVAGERRYQACLLLGLAEIPALIRDMDDEKAAVVALIENLQQKELNFFEEAGAYRMLMEVFGLDEDEIGRKVGKKGKRVADMLQLLKLSPEVQKKIVQNGIGKPYVRVLMKLNSPLLQMDVIDEITAKNLAVRETEELVEKLLKISPLRGNRDRYGESVIIRDERIFLNTIKETVKRARQTGIDICMDENDTDEGYQIVIKISKNRPFLREIVG